MSKPGPKPGRSAHSHHAGIYKADTVKDVAESLGITNLSEAVASALASDVEYRVHQVVEEASRFMRHARRTTLTSGDIDLALRTLNIEPIYGHTPHASTTFRRALPFPNTPSAGTVYFVEDEEIDFDKVLREEKIIIPKGVSWTAHWLAVEGVQPLVPENPPAVPREDAGPPSTVNGKSPQLGLAKPQQASTPQTQPNQLVKQVLSRELQLYYTRLTSSLLPPSTAPAETVKRTAALASLRADAGLQALLPYLVKWIGEGVVSALREEADSEQEGKTLEILLDVVSAILENSTLFIEPYHLLKRLGRVLTQHSTTYPSLSPRIMKTLLVALLAPPKPLGTREGAIRGLIGIGKEAVKKGILEGGGARIVGEEITASRGEGASGVVEAVMMALDTLQHWIPSREEDEKLIGQLRDLLGEFFASRVISRGDRGWAASLVASVRG
ncbi:TATA box binding protein associated factor-domain-containing protein [Pisolithus marmoratus]|nr:TATA box binding protein associated factor-domain-containing protein [Pisolithus marmoratus]